MMWADSRGGSGGNGRFGGVSVAPGDTALLSEMMIMSSLGQSSVMACHFQPNALRHQTD